MQTFEKESAYFFHTYRRLPVDIEKGQEAYLIATDGTRYLDMVGGIAVNALGYGHPSVVRAIEEQCRKYIHISNYFVQAPQVELAEQLVSIAGFPRVFFCNSGTEATEGAIKIARKWGLAMGKAEILSFTDSFHGRTMGALSLMDRESYRSGFEPLLANCKIAEFNNIGSLEANVGPATAAIFIECIQGEGGVRPATRAFANAITELQQRYGLLVIADEVQSGFGRTGRLFAFEHLGVKPDLVTLAKPIGGGLPLGAILGNDRVADVLQPGNHGTTFGGNPVACAAGLAVLRTISEERLVERAAVMGTYFLGQLGELREEFPALIRDIRGLGLMVGVELSCPYGPVIDTLRSLHVLVNGTAERVLRFLPPLIITTEQIDQTIHALRKALATISPS